MPNATDRPVRRGRRGLKKLAEPSAQEILDKAKREARSSMPAERRTIESAGQMLLPGHVDLPEMRVPLDARGGG